MIGCKNSECFLYWDKLIYELAPILNDLTKSFREADWNLHLSAVQRAIPLCFAFDRVNYKRWLPLYYEDCLQLSQNFPGIYAQFLKGDFVVRHTSRNGSAVPIDQALEKEYNKPAKSQAGIIGFTRRKEAVCKWNIIKHEKAKYRKFLSEVCLINEDDEYELHHEFSGTLIEKSEEYVSLVVEYIQQHGNPFDISKPRELINLTNRSKIDKEDANFLLNCPSLGKIECNEFYATRFEKKSLKLFDTIPKTRKIKKVTPKQTKQDLNRDCEILANCRLCSSKRI